MCVYAFVCTYIGGLTLILVSFLFVPYLIYFKILIICTCVCVCEWGFVLVRTVFGEARRGYLTPWNWCYWRLWTTWYRCLELNLGDPQVKCRLDCWAISQAVYFLFKKVNWFFNYTCRSPAPHFLFKKAGRAHWSVVLGIEPRSFTRALSAFSCWAIS